MCSQALDLHFKHTHMKNLHSMLSGKLLIENSLVTRATGDRILKRPEVWI